MDSLSRSETGSGAKKTVIVILASAWRSDEMFFGFTLPQAVEWNSLHRVKKWAVSYSEHFVHWQWTIEGCWPRWISHHHQTEKRCIN